MKIEINIMKKHLWMTLAVIVLLGAAGFVFATGYANTMASHATLFSDTIRGKTSGTVTVDDNLAVSGGATVANNLDVTGSANAANLGATDGLTVGSDASVGGNLDVAGVISGDGSGLTGVPGDCVTQESPYVAGDTSVSCDSGHPNALRGGCNSKCAWITRNEILGNTQYCAVLTSISPFCTGSGQHQVKASITCCK